MCILRVEDDDMLFKPDKGLAIILFCVKISKAYWVVYILGENYKF